MSAPRLERRTIRRPDNAPTFHPDQIAEAAKVLEFYGGDPGPLGEDALRRVLCAAAAWQEKQDAKALAQQKQREEDARWRDLAANENRIGCSDPGCECHGVERAQHRDRDKEIAMRQVEMKVGVWALRLLEEEKAR